MFGMMVDIGLKLYSWPPPLLEIDWHTFASFHIKKSHIDVLSKPFDGFHFYKSGMMVYIGLKLFLASSPYRGVAISMPQT